MQHPKFARSQEVTSASQQMDHSESYATPFFKPYVTHLKPWSAYNREVIREKPAGTVCKSTDCSVRDDGQHSDTEF